MLDAKAAVAWSILAGNIRVDRQQLGVGAVADGMNRDGQAGFVGRADVLAELIQGRDKYAGAARLIDEGFIHLGRTGAKGAVHKAFDAANLDPVVAEAALGAELGQLAPSGQRPTQINATA